ncbi:MAG: hypothetical protein HYR71_12175, partial [Chloroflexi bacterium]|nr:hypothetical protein [Chloroflexota bacterium]
PLRQGNASLGCWIPNATPTLYLKTREGKPDQVRLSLPRGEFELDLSVTDIRLYGPDHVTANPTVITAVNDRLQRGVEVILAVGLSRPFSTAPDRPEVHWLQVNNLHLRDKPLWPLGK